MVVPVRRFTGGGDTLPVPIVILVISTYLASASPFFLTANNLTNVLLQSVILGIVAFGSTFVILAGELDLSVSAGVALVSVLTATVMVETGSIALGLLAALTTGLVLGLLNGLLITKLKVPSFIATFATLIISHGWRWTSRTEAPCSAFRMVSRRSRTRPSSASACSSGGWS
jgi:ribose transport system permease protein